jgi:hypothetical protein
MDRCCEPSIHYQKLQRYTTIDKLPAVQTAYRQSIDPLPCGKSDLKFDIDIQTSQEIKESDNKHGLSYMYPNR